MEKLIILDYSTGETDIYSVELDQEPCMEDLLEHLGHDADNCQWMFSSGNIVYHEEIIDKNMVNEIEKPKTKI